MQRHKEDSFEKVEHQGRIKFKCLICLRLLATKQIVLAHLNSLHGLSPVKRHKKKYVDDPSIDVPLRTISRWKLNQRKVDTSTQPPSMLSSNSVNFFHSEVLPNEKDEQPSTAAAVEAAEKNTMFTELSTAASCSDDDQIIDNLDSLSDDSHLSTGSRSSLSDTTSEEYEGTSGESDDTDVTSNSDVDMAEISDLNCGNVSLTTSETQALKILSCFLRNNLSASTCKDVLTTLKDVYPESESIQRLTYENIWKYVDDSQMKESHYCVLCNQVFPDDEDVFVCEAERCDGLRYKGPLSAQKKKGRQPRQSFVFADVKSQLSSLLRSPGIWKDIQEQKRNLAVGNPGLLKDITDGQAYQQLRTEGSFLDDPHNLTAVFNTDGVNLYSSSKIELWPIFVAINELSPSFRFARDNMLLVGMWQGKGKPPFYQYFDLFSDQLNALYEEGIPLQTTEREITVKLAVICGVFDLPAKASILNMTYFNGSQACITCEEQGVVVQQGRGHARCYPHRLDADRFPVRTDADVRISMENGTEKRRIKGMKGKSGLMLLKGFDLVSGVVPDYMHGVLLGVTKTLLYRWFSPTQSGKAYFVGNKLKEISKRLQNIKPLEFIERLPRDIEKNYGNFKATELQAWLLYYSIPCLLGILDKEYLEHFAQLSEAIHLLLGDNINKGHLNRAKILLDSFYRKFTHLYQQGSCGLNVHNIGAHLVSYVEEYGPIWAWSCFAFEDANAMLLQSVHGTGNVVKQVMRVRQAKTYLRTLGVSDGETSKWKKVQEASNCSTAGSPKPLEEDEFTNLLLSNLPVKNLGELKKFYRVICDDQRYYAEGYTRMQKRDCSMVMLQNGNVASIKYFVLCLNSNLVYAMLTPYAITNRRVMHDLEAGLHLKPVCTTTKVDYVRVDDIVERLLFIDTKSANFHSTYIARLPNSHGHSVFK